ncbi:hypothetical protein ACFLZH_04515, partial [Patescibacteria group bacterium]
MFAILFPADAGGPRPIELTLEGGTTGSIMVNSLQRMDDSYELFKLWGYTQPGGKPFELIYNICSGTGVIDIQDPAVAPAPVA